MKSVSIIISGEKTGDVYYASSYPHHDMDNDSHSESYATPVYKVYLSSGDRRKEWKALRFMPFWNDPKKPSSYRTKGWLTAGLSLGMLLQKIVYYNPNYQTLNRPSPHDGAFQINGNFLIHSGPSTLMERGWGSAGCVEIVGNFKHFKEEIVSLAGIIHAKVDQALQTLVRTRNPFVEVKYAPRRNLRSKR